jgi:2,5-dihydroxypyridine 5,6-dioxygenase
MFADRIEGKWIDAFCEVFERCAVKPGDTAAICPGRNRARSTCIWRAGLLQLAARPSTW